MVSLLRSGALDFSSVGVWELDKIITAHLRFSRNNPNKYGPLNSSTTNATQSAAKSGQQQHFKTYPVRTTPAQPLSRQPFIKNITTMTSSFVLGTFDVRFASHMIHNHYLNPYSFGQYGWKHPNTIILMVIVIVIIITAPPPRSSSSSSSSSSPSWPSSLSWLTSRSGS